MRSALRKNVGVFELRSFQGDDAEAIWKLHDAALEDAGVHGGRGPWEHDLRDIAATYLEPGGEFLVGLAGVELVGMRGLLRHTSEQAEVKARRLHEGVGYRETGRRLQGRFLFITYAKSLSSS